jgi:plasmid maintenance system antidote protein VapI
VTRQALSAFGNERSDLSPEMALRTEVALGPKAEVMMGIQTDYAMARARARLPEIAATVRRIARSIP